MKLRLSHITIRNFRNFKNLDVALGGDVVVVGENGVGKSNLLYALRLILDPQLPDSARQLRIEDFWDGLSRPLKASERIDISIDVTDFESNENQLAVLADHVVSKEPLTARLSYVFQKSELVEGDPTKESDYEFICYGGDRLDNTFGYDVRSHIPVSILPALRDAESDVANWRRSPLRPLLDRATAKIDRKALEKVVADVAKAGSVITDIPEIEKVEGEINSRLERMVGKTYASDVGLGIAPSDPDRLIRALRIFIDEGTRSISEASLGAANLLYLGLMALELEKLADEGNRAHTFLAIEEPEAHLHPHLQRLVFRDFLRTRTAHGRLKQEQTEEEERTLSVVLTTHSPHIASVAPLGSIVMLRHSKTDGTFGSSTARLGLEAQEVADIERYLDVTRGEILFGRAVILVEGDAELFLLPVLAKLGGVDLEELGITVCSVSGTNFEPYVKLLGPSGLAIPFAVVTDGDLNSDGKSLGRQRVRKLLEVLTPDTDLSAISESDIVQWAQGLGLFVGERTFESDLFSAGRHVSMCTVLSELTKYRVAAERAATWKEKPETVDHDRLMKDIEAIGKGRFAQRLATKINKDICPGYVKSAIEYIVGVI